MVSKTLNTFAHIQAPARPIVRPLPPERPIVPQEPVLLKAALFRVDANWYAAHWLSAESPKQRSAMKHTLRVLRGIVAATLRGALWRRPLRAAVRSAEVEPSGNMDRAAAIARAR